jgi:hypothetical protein
VATCKPFCQFSWKEILIVSAAYDEGVKVKTHAVKDMVNAVGRIAVSRIHICTLDDGRRFMRGEYNDLGAIVDDSAVYLAFGFL